MCCCRGCPGWPGLGARGAPVRQLAATGTDDALELLELLMGPERIGRARQEAGKEAIKRHPRLARASAMLAVVAQVLLEARDWGSDNEVRVCQVWEAIEARIPRAEVRAAVDTVTGMLPPPEALPEPDWRAELAKKTHAVVGLCKMLTATITFGANAQGAPVLAAMTALGEQLATDTRWTAGNPRIHPQVVTGPWRPLVFRHPPPAPGTVDPRRLHLLRAGAVLPPPETPGDLRRVLDAVPQPASAAAGRCGVGGGQGRRADHAGPARGSRCAAGLPRHRAG